MQRFSQFISEHIPWFWGVLAWSLVIFILLAIAALAAYFILFPIAANVKRAIKVYLDRLAYRQQANREARLKSMDALIEDFRLNSGISLLPEHSNRVEGAFASFSTVAKKLKPQLDSCVDIPKKFAQIQDRFSAVAARIAPPFPDAPPADHIVTDDGSIRIAWVRLSVSSVVLIALITANTGMLSEILRDLNFIPHELVYFGIHLYVVLAFVLTLVEAGVGVWHAASLPSHQEKGHVKVAPVIAICFAVIIAGVEGFFYSQVAPSKDSIFNLPFDYQIKQGSLFFLWGATLVLVLFALGSVWMASLERINGRSDFPSILARISKLRHRYSEACESAERSGSRVREQLEAVHQKLVDAAQQTSSISASIVELRNGRPGTLSEPSTPQRLTNAHAYHLVHSAAIWLLLTLAVIVIFAATGFYGVGYSFPVLRESSAFGASLGLAACFVVLGLLLPRGELFLDGHGERRVIVSGSHWRGRAAIILAVCVVCGFAALLWQVPLARHYLAFWIGILILGASLAATSSQTIALAKGLRVWFHSCGNFLAFCVGGIWRLLCRMVFGVFLVVEVLALALAAPIYVIRGRPLPSLHSDAELPAPKAFTARRAS